MSQSHCLSQNSTSTLLVTSVAREQEVTKLPFVLLCTSEECDIERERGDLISRGQEEAVAIGKNCSFPGVSDLGSSNSGKPLCPKSQSPTSP